MLIELYIEGSFPANLPGIDTHRLEDIYRLDVESGFQSCDDVRPGDVILKAPQKEILLSTGLLLRIDVCILMVVESGT